MFSAFVAARYLTSRREPRFASFLTVVSVLGVAVGIAALITVISVMSGFGSELESKLMGFNPHITITSSKQFPNEIESELKKISPEIVSVSPFVIGEVVLQAPGEEGFSAMGGRVYGLPKIPDRMKSRTKFIWSGGISDDVWWLRVIPELKSGLVLGSEMMYQLGVFPDLRSRVQLIAPFGSVDPFGNPAPKKREFRVSGGFKSGFFEYDTKYILMPYDEAKKFLGITARGGFEVMLKNSSDVPAVEEKIKKYLGDDFTVSGWTSKNKKLFAALKLEKIAMTVVLFMIVVIASFSIVGVALMIFFSKRKDLAIMMSVGATASQVKRVFLIHGGLIGLAGSLLGALIGVTACYVLKRSNVHLPPTYYLDYLPVYVNYFMVALVTIGGVLISLLAAYYPAKRASEMETIELLRYE